MRADTLRGHLEAMILAVLETEPLHGYAIMETLRRRSEGNLDIPTGTLYPALRRLERAGYLRSEWTAVGARKRRSYQLTKAGRQMLDRERKDWDDFARVVQLVLDPQPHTGEA